MISPVSSKRFPWYRRRWLKITGLIIGAVVVLALIASVVLYALWQSRPEKALLDAVNHATATPATYEVTGTGTKLAVGVDNQRFTASGTLNSIPLDAVYSENTLYVKSSKIEELYDTYFAQSIPELFAETVKSSLMKLQNRWISIDLNRAASSTGMGGATKCGLENLNQFTSDDAPKLQLAIVYGHSSFLNTKTLATTSIQSTYQITVDQPKLKAFYGEISKFDTYKNQNCMTENNPLLSNYLIGSTVDTSVTRPDHHFRDMTIHDTSNSTTKIHADYTKTPTIIIPTDVVTYDQIANSLLRTFLSSFIGSR